MQEFFIQIRGDTRLEAQQPDGVPRPDASRFLLDSDLAVAFADPARPDAPLDWVNDAFCRLAGHSRDEVLGRNCRFLQGPLTDRASVVQVRESIAAQRFRLTELINYRGDGDAFRNALLVGPVHGPHGALVRLFGMQWDLDETLRRRREAGGGEWWHLQFHYQLERFERQIEQVASASTALGGPAAGIALVERLVAMSRPQQYPPLERLPNWTRARTLLHFISAPYRELLGDRLRLDGTGEIVAADVATPLALAVHELCSRSRRRSGVGPDRPGIELHADVSGIDGESTFTLSWKEALVAPAADARPDPGIDESGIGPDAGLGIVRELAREVGGSFEHASGGGLFEARLALPNRPHLLEGASAVLAERSGASDPSRGLSESAARTGARHRSTAR